MQTHFNVSFELLALGYEWKLIVESQFGLLSYNMADVFLAFRIGYNIDLMPRPIIVHIFIVMKYYQILLDTFITNC